jgi:hypothetical protein
MKILPRAIDKARAQNAGTLGEYVFYDCPINRMLFDALNISDEAFLDAVRRSPGDDDVVRWIHDEIKPDPDAIDAVNARIEVAEPQTDEQRASFRSDLVAMRAEHLGITRWADLLDLRESPAKPVKL